MISRKERLPLFCWLAVCALATMARNLTADCSSDYSLDDSLTRALSHMVQISVSHDTAVTAGCGIIVGFRENRLIIATASHVIRQFGTIKRITVRFPSVPGMDFEAALADFQQSGLDLAFIYVGDVVARDIAERNLPPLPWDSPDWLSPGQDVYSFRLPEENVQDVNSKGSFASTFDNKIEFVSSSITQGNSGGPLLDSYGNLIGMIIEKGDSGQNCAALSIKSVSDYAAAWHVADNLLRRVTERPLPILYHTSFAKADGHWSATGAGTMGNDTALQLTPKQNSFIKTIYTGQTFGDFAVSADVALSTGNKGSTAGLIFWANDSLGLEFYCLEIRPAGRLAIGHFWSNSWYHIIRWSDSSAVHDDHNCLEIVVHGDVFTPYVNGSKIGMYRGLTPQGGSYVGLYGESGADVQNNWIVSSFTVRDASAIPSPNAPEYTRWPDGRILRSLEVNKLYKLINTSGNLWMHTSPDSDPQSRVLEIDQDAENVIGYPREQVPTAISSPWMPVRWKGQNGYVNSYYLQSVAQ